MLVSDNGITKLFQEYKGTEEDENALFTFLLFVEEAAEVSYRGMKMNDLQKKKSQSSKILLTS